METFESSKKLEIRPVSVGFSKMGIWLPFPSARKCGVMCSPLAVWYLCAWTLVLPSEDQGMTGNAKKQWSWCGGLQPRNATLSFLLLRDPPGTFWHPWSQGERDVSAGPQGMFGLSGDILGCHNRSRKVRWHLGGGGQGCCSTSTVHRTAPNAKSYQTPNVSSATQNNSAMPKAVWSKALPANDWLSGL